MPAHRHPTPHSTQSDAGARLHLRYFGASAPRAEREIASSTEFKIDGHADRYVIAYCHTRAAPHPSAVARPELFA